MAKLVTATHKLLQLKKKIRAAAGGTGASKTYSIIMILIDYAQAHDSQKIDVVSESYPHLEDGAIRDFKEIMIAQNYWNDSRWNGTQHTYEFETGSIIKFLSFDKLGKAHGPRRDVLFLNECNYLPFNTIDQLITRTRKIVWMDWNPSAEFWFYSEILPKRKDVDFITLTYKDNEALSESERNEIESRKGNTNWWKVYGLGQLGEIEGRIYTGWQMIDEVPFEARLERYGLDFGYSADPTAIVAIYYYNNGWILDEKVYKKGMSNKDIADSFQALPQKLIIADSAEPKSIDELRSYDLNVMSAKKGKDSVRNGIQLIQPQPISVTKRSVNLIKEYRNYLWLIDKNGKIINEPQSFQNHLMDASRYALETLSKLEPPKNYWDELFNEELSPQLKRKLNPAR